MSQEKKHPCPYYFAGKCYANAAVSPEEYDAHPPNCPGVCQAMMKKNPLLCAK